MTQESGSGGCAEPCARGADQVLALLTLLALAPFWSSALVLSVDLPQHLAIAAIASAYDDPARRLAEHYVVDLWPRPYVLTTWLLQALGALGSFERAGRILLSAYAVLLVLSVRALVRSARGRDPRLAWFAVLFVHGWSVAYGFLPFVLALPAMIGALAVARRLLDAPTLRGGAALAVLLALALLAHPLAAALAGVALAPLLLLGGPRPRRLIALAAAIGLGAVLLVSSASGLRARPEVEVRLGDEEIENRFRPGIKHKLLEYAVAYLPGHLDHAAVIPGAAALLGCALMGARRARAGKRSSCADPLEISLLALFAVYLATPADLALGSFRVSLLGQRLVIPLWLVACAIPRGRLPAPLVWAGAISAMAFTGLVTAATVDFGTRWGTEVSRAIGEVPAGARVLPRVAAPADPVLNPRLVSTPELALHAYVMLGAAGFDPLIFSTRQSPVQIRADAPHLEAPARFDRLWVQAAEPRIELKSAD